MTTGWLIQPGRRDGMFSMDKWYMDAVTERGDVLIGYRVTFRWLRFSLSCAASLAAPGSRRPTVRFFCADVPERNDTSLTWGCRPVHVRGTWKTVVEGPNLELLCDEATRIVWHNLQALSAVRFSAGGPDVHGRGYVERMQVRLDSSRRPMDDLIWGRFCGREHSVVWIQWKGPMNRAWLMHNGKVVAQHENITEPQRWSDCELRCSDSAILTDGPVLTKWQRGMLRVVGCMPSWLDTAQTKWRSRGALYTKGRRVDEGWVIHEHVRFR